jgi:acetate kinase
MVLWLLERTGMTQRDLSYALEHESGLFALAGTADMREVLAAVGRGERDARLALDVYTHRLRAGIAAMAATLGGLDAVAFTGGIGQRSAEVRAAAVDGLEFLGLAIDGARNDSGRDDREITAPGARVRTLVIAAREDLEIARQARAVMRARS